MGKCVGGIGVVRVDDESVVRVHRAIPKHSAAGVDSGVVDAGERHQHGQCRLRAGCLAHSIGNDHAVVPGVICFDSDDGVAGLRCARHGIPIKMPLITKRRCPGGFDAEDDKVAHNHRLTLR